jgi:hypothetical protein
MATGLKNLIAKKANKKVVSTVEIISIIKFQKLSIEKSYLLPEYC